MPLPTGRLGRCGAWVLVGLVALLPTCTPSEPPQVVPGAREAVPEIRVGLMAGVARLTVSGDSGLVVRDADGSEAASLGPGEAWNVRPQARLLSAGGASGTGLADQQSVTFEPRMAGGRVLVNGRAYRGTLRVARDRSGLTAVNLVGLEDYLLGVVPAEMGRRDPGEVEALAAQAILSRTFAIRNLGKRAGEGFDLYATVADQVYGGVQAENPLATDAVRRTAGLILTWQGSPIDAFFHSTCAGRTADGTEVFAGADRPYLHSIRDQDSGGEAWCRLSPRYHWREEWTSSQLRQTLRQTLPAAIGTAADQAATVQAVAIASHTPSGRVARLTIQLAQGSVEVSGPAVRQVLRPAALPLLRSAIFELRELRQGGRLQGLVAEGGGAGHGVGLCQWGAVGRARAGQDASGILTAYFPGTEVTRAY